MKTYQLIYPEEYADLIEDLDLDLIWEAVGPDAYENHNEVGMEVRALIAEENWLELGRLLGEGAKNIYGLSLPMRSRPEPMIKDFKHLAQPKRSAFDRYLIIECLMIAAVVALAFFTI